MGSWPNNVGICAIEFIFPMQYVDQTELEKYDGASAGKYTIGLGQKEMGFCSDREDINSLCLTALNQLVEKSNLSYADIGRLDVGTETIIDKSKSVKTVLMDLFVESKNFNVEGLDTTNACYGGTAALFNALDWVESSSWDGRFAIVIAGDIAIYAEGNARPTGGAGAVAMLVGPNAPLVIERGLRSTFMTNVYDFYKPDLTSEYPVVDGQLSVKCYLNALDNCYKVYCDKLKEAHFNLSKFDAFVFHSPYCKLVQKSFARLHFNDFIRSNSKSDQFPGLERFKDVKLEDTYFDKDVEKTFIDRSKELFETKTKSSLMLASRVGNMYTASVYSCLVSYLIATPMADLLGKRIGVFSYGSGLASSLYSIRVTDSPYLEQLLNNLKVIPEKLDSRKRVSPAQFSAILQQRADSLHCAPCIPQGSIDDIFPATWYLEKIDAKHRRSYARK